MKTKQCKVCGNPFAPRRPLQRVCDLQCAVKDARQKRSKEEEKAHRKAMREYHEANKTLSQRMREAQQSFNRYIRIRDATEPCISCGIFYGQMHAGHYRTTAAAPQLRYNHYNVNKQCAQCNSSKSGNIPDYRLGLLERYGAEIVEQLECNNSEAGFTHDYLKRVKQLYSKRAKHLERLRERIQSRTHYRHERESTGNTGSIDERLPERRDSMSTG